MKILTSKAGARSSETPPPPIKKPRRYGKAFLVAYGIAIWPWFAPDVGRELGIQLTILAGINLTWGFLIAQAGLFTFAPLAFAAIGGYTSAYFTTRWGWPLPIAGLTGVFAAAIGGAVVALPSLKLHGIHFALLTFGFSELVRSSILATNPEILGSSYGISGVPGFFSSASYTGQRIVSFYLGMLLLAATLSLVTWLRKHPFGLSLALGRDSEAFAEGVGIHLAWRRWLALAAGSATFGLWGVFYAHANRAIAPSLLGFDFLVFLLMILVVGGWGSPRGILWSTALFLAIDEVLVSKGILRPITLALIALGTIILTNEGLPAYLRDTVRRLMGRPTRVSQGT